MNTTIEQLAEQAAQESALLKNDLNLEVTVDDKSYMIPASFIERFAELIVKKCVVVGNYAYDGGEYPGPMIKEYFGVE